jgi:hypothetical protein
MLATTRLPIHAQAGLVLNYHQILSKDWLLVEG